MSLEKEKEMKKILIWGTGRIAKEFVSKLDSTDVISGFIQTNPVESSFCDWHIYLPNDLPEGDYYIIVANSFSDEIHRIC